MARFVVDLGDQALSEDQRHAMATAIHGAVLSQIATHGAEAGAAPLATVATIDGMMRRPAAHAGAAPADLEKAAKG